MYFIAKHVSDKPYMFCVSTFGFITNLNRVYPHVIYQDKVQDLSNQMVNLRKLRLAVNVYSV